MIEILSKGVFINKKAIAKCTVIFVLAAAIFSLSTCDYFITDTIRVTNASGADTIRAHIHYNEDEYTSEYDIGPGGASHDFDITFIDTDKFGEITVYVYNYATAATVSTSGNIAENDWLTVVTYPADF